MCVCVCASLRMCVCVCVCARVECREKERKKKRKEKNDDKEMPSQEFSQMYRDICSRAQELCESHGGCPGLPSLISLRFLWNFCATLNQQPSQKRWHIIRVSLSCLEKHGVKVAPLVTVTYFSLTDSSRNGATAH